ncbi:MAG: hypothetical protein QM214_04885 [Bacillota bacterium]|nr:hypothetical protein [Bacillota bacterium]
MIYIYKEDDLILYEREKKRLIIIYCIALAVFCGIVVTLTLTAKAQSYIYFLIANIIVSAAFAFFSFLYFGIKVKLTQKHIELLKMITGTKSQRLECQVISREKNLITHMGLEFYQLKIEYISNGKEVVRKVFYRAQDNDSISDFPTLEICSNIVIAYGGGARGNG